MYSVTVNVYTCMYNVHLHVHVHVVHVHVYVVSDHNNFPYE